MSERIIFHFHWPSRYYLDPNRGEPAANLDEWFEFLKAARTARCPIVWTAHNIWPHDHLDTQLEVHQIARKALVESAAHVIAHCCCAAVDVVANFGAPKDLSIIPHPSYVVEPGLTVKARTRTSDGLSMLCLGALRPYKNLEFLIRAFTSSAGMHDRLVIAGPAHSSYDPTGLRGLCAKDGRIRLDERAVPEAELQCLLSAADVVVFAYSQIMSSGGVILAQSHGKPVIAPDMGCLAEWVTPEVGELYQPNSVPAFGAAVERLRKRDLERLGINARVQASIMTPALFAGRLSAIYALASSTV